MMSRSVRTLRWSLPLAAVFMLSPIAGTVAHAEVPKVRRLALVDMQRVMNETAAGKRAQQELESSSKAKQQKLDKKRTELEAGAGKLKNLKGEQLMAAQEKLQQESMELQKMLYALQQDLAEQENKMIEGIYRNSQAIVGKLAKDMELDLVLVRDEMTVIYADAGLDVTAAVIRDYNQKHK